MSGARTLFHNIWDIASSLSIGKWRGNFTMSSVRSICRSSQLKKDDSLQTEVVTQQTQEFVSPSPYKNPGPRRYGYQAKYKTEGCLPRTEKRVRSLPKYKPINRWETKSALFGQNDYIDILGDGDVHPSDLLTGPQWLVAFKGNERDRLLRKMEWQGHRTRVLYPAEYNRMEKRIRYLTKLYNTKRHIKKID